jgi:tetratricopeptide (TPR) repeat protein
MARLCSCESGLSAERCCEAPAAALAASPAAWRLDPLLNEAQKALEEGQREKARGLLVDVLELAPGRVDALVLLARLHREAGRLKPAEALLRRAVQIDPNHVQATQDLALVLFNGGKMHEAERMARFAVRLAPRHPQSHNLLGMVLTELNRPWLGAYHYEQARKLGGARDPILAANLAWSLKNAGEPEAARALYEEAVRARPEELRTWIGYAALEEADRNAARSLELLDRAVKATGASPVALRLSRATALNRLGRDEEALAVLEEGVAESPLGPLELSLKGRILDRLGRFDEAFAHFRAGKARALEQGGRRYMKAEAENLARRLAQFFTADRLSLISRPRPPVALDSPSPIFIVGFPRSGTTLIEQILSSHPDIDGGDELPFITDLADNAPRLLGSPLSYPEALSETWMADHRDDLELLRDHYLRAAQRAGLPRKKGVRFITDKMPLNEMHLGLIGLLFPDAPIIHLIRHPLDVVLSVFSNHLTHGFYCASELETIAAHYRLVMDLVAHYRGQMTLRYLPVRYEDVIADPEGEVRRILSFVGVDFDPACLAFHENRRHARTASYAQVTEPLYDRSVFRHRHYASHLAPVREALADWIVRLGYEKAPEKPVPTFPSPFVRRDGEAEAAPALNPAEIEALVQAAVREETQGAYDQAREKLDRVLAAAPDHPHAHHIRGIIAFRQKDFHRARHHMELSVSLAPQVPLYPRNLCEVYRRLWLYEAALRSAARAVELAPNDIIALCNLGVVHLHRLSRSRKPSPWPSGRSPSTRSIPPPISCAPRRCSWRGGTRKGFPNMSGG